MPNFPIVDSHLHLWDVKHLSYPWLEDIPELNRTFLLEDYDKATEDIEIEKMVFVQCECEPSSYAQESAWVTETAKTDPRIAGIVSWAPLEKGEAVRHELEQLVGANPLLKGIRRIIQFEEDPEFCLQPDFIRGVQLLGDYNLTFDICIATLHMPNVIAFVRQVPQVKMILDHIGKPGIKAGEFDLWAKGITQLSALENVHCKVSSLATEADHHHWTRDSLKPYVEHVFNSFGFDRCIFGGDWPVSSLAASFSTCVSTLEDLTAGSSTDEKEKLFRTNALAFYNLNEA